MKDMLETKRWKKCTRSSYMRLGGLRASTTLALAIGAFAGIATRAAGVGASVSLMMFTNQPQISQRRGEWKRRPEVESGRIEPVVGTQEHTSALVLMFKSS